MLRLFSILAILPIAYFFFQSGNAILVGIIVLLIIAFIFLVNWHQNLHEEEQRLKTLVTINENELLALEGNYKPFPSGEKYINQAHSYSYDMDLFGHHSLFQSLCRTCTALGEKRLAEILANPLKSKEAILIRQEVIAELSTKPEFRQEFQAAGQVSTETAEGVEELYHWIDEPSAFLYSRFWQIARYAGPAFLTGSLIFYAFDPRGLVVVVGGILLNWVLWTLASGKVNEIHSRVSRKNGILSKYLRLLQLNKAEHFESEELKSMQRVGEQSLGEIKLFAKIVNNFDQRLNLIVAAFLNTFLLFDVHCAIRLEKWKDRNKSEIRDWFATIFEIDALNSLGNFSYTHPQFIFPEIDTESFSIKGSNLGHPLISVEECIANDLSLGAQEQMVILTGANMSGKSTFLRTLGLNTILALIGSPVFASSFRCPILQVKTSMRLTDSIAEGASYFFAELKRLQTIVEDLEKGEKLLIILDEILKGTNSDDKLSGSIELIRKFVLFDSLGIIATHDLELGKLEDEMPGQVRNYCFESTIANDQLSFDYSLRPGIAQNKNATFLMRKMGIVNAS